MDADNFWVRREDDTGEDRTYYQCSKCPREEQCTALSWKRLLTASFVLENLHTSIKDHLKNSSHHGLSEEDAEAAAMGMDVDVKIETLADREAYRQQQEKAAARAAQDARGRERPQQGQEP